MKIFLRIIFVTLLIAAVFYFLSPKPKQPNYASILPVVPSIDKLEDFVTTQESKFKIKPGNEAQIIWADSSNKQTEYAVVYLHGFSASKEEGNPAHTYLAHALHANLYLSRLADHGLDTVAPMEYFTAGRLWESAKQAYAIGKKLGKKVIIMGTSTGGTLALQLGAAYPEINSLVLMSPNIGINDKNAWLLNDPWGLQIARIVSGGDERQVLGKTATYKKYWYTNYRLEAVVQLEELIESSMSADLFNKVKQPVLMLYYYKNDKEQDPVVKVDAMLKMFGELGTTTADKEKIALPNTGHHVIGSPITSKDVEGVTRAMGHFIKNRLSSE